MTNAHNNFDTIAGEYDETIPAHVIEHYGTRRLEVIRRWYPAGATLLDVGCGTGRLTSRVARAGFRVTGADFSAGMLQEARTRGARVVQASGGALPFPDNSFDGAYCIAVLHHLITPALVRATIAEMLRVITPDGFAIIWDHNPLNPYWPFFMKRLVQDDGSERLVGRPEILADVAAGGGAAALSTRMGFVPDFTPSALLGAASAAERALEALPFTRWIAAHNVVIAKKRTRPA